MATLRTIRNRIKGTRNIKQITRAMEAVSAVKMRKSQWVALAARPYATAALNILKNISASTRSDLVSGKRSDLENTLLVVVTSDKGLAGPFNTNVLKKSEAFIKELDSRFRGNDKEGHGNDSPRVQIAAVGKKATDYFSRRGRKPVASWTGFGDYAELAEVEPIFKAVVNSFCGEATLPSIPPLKRGEGSGVQADEVYIIYTNFLSAMKQEVVVRKLLPFSEEGLEEMVRGIVPEKGRFAEHDTNYTNARTNDSNSSGERFRVAGGGIPSEARYSDTLLEPSQEEIFDSLLPALLKIQIYHAILEANASEHSSRMVAMRNATDNASELIKSYTVSMNKARQTAINKELAEITGGSEALAA